MIKRYIVRDNIDNGHMYGEPMGLFASYDRSQIGYDTKEKAMEAVKRIVKRDPSVKEKLYVTETEYADIKRQRQDFHITSYICWSAWFNGYDE